jgi:hypothetical protein
MLSVSEIHFIHIDEIETSSSLNHDKVGKKFENFLLKKVRKFLTQKVRVEKSKIRFFNLNVGFLDRKNHTFRTE